MKCGFYGFCNTGPHQLDKYFSLLFQFAYIWKYPRFSSEFMN